MTPDQLEAIQRKCRLVGDRGEHFVYQLERKRLYRAGKPDLADKVDWISRRTVNAGYDIKSYDVDGAPRFIEVKATIGKGNRFCMSRNEWKVASNKGTSYWLYRVIETLTTPKIVKQLQDPVKAEKIGKLLRTPDGWLVTIA